MTLSSYFLGFWPHTTLHREEVKFPKQVRLFIAYCILAEIHGVHKKLLPWPWWSQYCKYEFHQLQRNTCCPCSGTWIQLRHEYIPLQDTPDFATASPRGLLGRRSGDNEQFRVG